MRRKEAPESPKPQQLNKILTLLTPARAYGILISCNTAETVSKLIEGLDHLAITLSRIICSIHPKGSKFNNTDLG